MISLLWGSGERTPPSVAGGGALGRPLVLAIAVGGNDEGLGLDAVADRRGHVHEALASYTTCPQQFLLWFYPVVVRRCRAAKSVMLISAI